jgi:hypothetical protein
MPVRILYWNIEKFGINKFNDPDNHTRRPRTSLNRSQASHERLDYIWEHLVAAAPDIIVIVELTTARDGAGYLVRGGSGTTATLQFLDIIRAATQESWGLVPPLQTGGREAVAVYYRLDKFVFAGPYLWPGGGGRAFEPADGHQTGIYPHDFDDEMPLGNVPAGVPNAGMPMNRVAAATTGFRVTAADMLHAGDPVDFTGQRAPYWVTLAEMDHTVHPPTVRRLLNLFAIHAPADDTAGAYLAKLGTVRQIVDNIQPNEVRVVLGDFNVNLLSNGANRNQTQAYGTLLNAGYALGISRPGNPPNPIDGWGGYFATHLKPDTDATYWSKLNPAQTVYYPGFGFTGSSFYANFYSIDNILTMYGGAAGAGIQNVTILNGIVGSPLAVINAPPGNPPVGHVNFPILMRSPRFAVPAPVEPPLLPGQVARIVLFRNWNNYLRIRSTSDHMAIVADL